eukprot:2345297-Prorocentrum_lima.AAC.1
MIGSGQPSPIPSVIVSFTLQATLIPWKRQSGHFRPKVVSNGSGSRRQFVLDDRLKTTIAGRA